MIDVIKSFDLYWLKQIHNLTLNPYLAYIFYVLADFVFLIYPFYLVLNWLYAHFYIKDFNLKLEYKRNLLLVFFIVAISIFSLLMISKFELLPMRERPETALINSKGLILNHLPDNSFPSNHATSSMAFAIALILIGWKLTGYIFLFLGFLSGFSRIAVGVHWPTDIIVGFLIGFLLAFLLVKFRYYIDKYFSDYMIKLASFFRL